MQNRKHIMLVGLKPYILTICYPTQLRQRDEKDEELLRERFLLNWSFELSLFVFWCTITENITFLPRRVNKLSNPHGPPRYIKRLRCKFVLHLCARVRPIASEVITEAQVFAGCNLQSQFSSRLLVVSEFLAPLVQGLYCFLSYLTKPNPKSHSTDYALMTSSHV